MPRSPRDSVSRTVRTRRPRRRVQSRPAASRARPRFPTTRVPSRPTTGRCPACRKPSRYSVMALTEPDEGNRIAAGTRPPSTLRAAPLSAASTTSAPASRRAGAIRLGRSWVRGSSTRRPRSGPPSTASRIASPPSASRSWARASASASAGARSRTSITASRVLRSTRLPSGAAIAPVSRKRPPFQTAWAPTGAWQPPRRVRRNARSARTARVVTGSPRSASSRVASGSPARHSIPSAPCATAGVTCSTANGTVWVARAPSRFSPAQASTIASYRPSRSLRRRVSTLPRMSRYSRSGRSAAS